MLVGIGLVAVPVLALTYSRVNARRDVLQKEMEEKGIKYTADQIRDMGDRAPDFRYTL